MRNGNDISISFSVSAVDATLGCEVQVPTVYGDVTMKIPAGTQTGTVMRLKGKGVKNMRGDTYGDQEYVQVNVSIPKKLSKKEKDLYTKLKELDEKESISSI